MEPTRSLRGLSFKLERTIIDGENGAYTYNNRKYALGTCNYNIENHIGGGRCQKGEKYVAFSYPEHLIRQYGTPLAQCEHKMAQISITPAPIFLSTNSAL